MVVWHRAWLRSATTEVVFSDLIESNDRYLRGQHLSLQAGAARGLAVLTCMDSRIDPLTMLGLGLGEAKIIRNAGARVTEDVLRSLTVAVNYLGVDRICIVHHTDCALAARDDLKIRSELADRYGVDTDDFVFLAGVEQGEAARSDLELLRGCPLIPNTVRIGLFVLDVVSGRLAPLPLRGHA